MSEQKLRQLGELAGIIRDRELGRLSLLAKEARQLKAGIDARRQAVADRSAQLAATGNDAAALAGADAKWQAHLERERAEMSSRLALLLAEREKARKAAARALGRADVLDQLANREAEKR